MRKVYGAPLSPFVRKVLLTLETKGLEYELDPIVPMDLPTDFYQISPLGKIPAYTDDEVRVSDSSVICQYLEDRHPEVSLYPTNAAQRAQARWFEEYADTKLIEVLGPPLFYERVIKPQFLKEATDEERVKENIEHGIPPVLDYLESQVPRQGFLFGDQPGIADLAIFCPFVNATMANYEVDAKKWPKLVAYLGRLKSQPIIAQRLAAENVARPG